MSSEGVPAFGKKEDKEGVLYNTVPSEASEAMKVLGFEGKFAVCVNDIGGSYLVYADPQFKEGIDPLDVTPTSVVMPKDQSSFEDAKAAADKMREDLLAGKIE